MNSLYFFLPFILIASAGIYQQSFAVETVIGYDYFDTTNPDGTHNWSSHHPYILNQQGQYVPFLNDGNKVETNHGSVILNSDGSYSFYKKGIIDDTPLFTDRVIAKYADITNLNSWTYPNSINNDTPDVSWDGDNFVSTKQATIGKLEYKYILSNGSWKTQLEATNLSTLTTKAFGFDQIIDLNRDTIFFGGQQRNLDNFDGITFDKTWLENNKGNVIDVLNDVLFDFDLGFENLYSVTIHDTGVGSSQLIFDYRTTTPLLPNKTLIIDPTFNSATSNDGRLRSAGAAGATCPTTYNTTDSQEYALTDDSGSGSNDTCQVAYFKYDLSAIPSTAVIANGYFEYDVVASAGSPVCRMIISSTNTVGQQMYSDGIFVGSGVNATSTFSACSSVGDGKQQALSTSAFSTLQSKFGGTVTMLMSSATKARPAGSTDYAQLRDSDAVLHFVYANSRPPPPANLACTGLPYGFSCSWTAVNATGVTGYYIAKSTNNSTWTGVTALANVTSTTYSGFGVNESSYIRVNATNVVNSTSSNVVYATTDNYPDAPSLNAVAVSTSQINVERTAGASNGGDVVDDYGLFVSINGGSWQTLVSNSTIVNFYNHTGLKPNYEYSYRWRDGNDVGWSNNGTDTTTTLFTTYSSLAPTGLIVYPDPPSPSKLDLQWTAPAMQNISGYRIQREAPVGGGFSTIVTNTTNTNIYYNNTGLSVNTYYNYRVYALNASGMTGASNTYSQTTYHLPDAVDDLIVTPTDLLSFNLDWSQPNTLYGYLLGYNINYTTPEGEPLTVYIANTGNSNTEYEVTGASGENGYSFRVSAITIHGKNVTGANIANGTVFDAFAIGTLDISAEGEDERPIVFSIYPIDSDTSDVVVTYDPALQLACDFRYTLAGSNTTYTGLTENINGALVYSNFTINGINNDIIDIDCWDELDTTTRGQERIGQSAIPIVDQVNDFQDGLYGTSGQFGAFDMMTIIIIIVSMIGFNRTHPYVGVIVMFAVLGFARYYGFIQDITVASGLIILVIALAIAYGRRDNEA